MSDSVEETLVRALAQWPLGGVPANPAGWLYQAAKHRAIDVLRRERTFRRFAPDLTRQLESASATPLIDNLFGAEQIEDDTLRMMFTCCHPGLPLESQIALTLKSSPILALNRAIALAERRGPRAGLEAIQSIPDQVWRATTCSGPPWARCIYGSASSAGPRRISNARSR